MPNTYSVVGTCNPNGTLKPYGTTAPKAPGNRNDPIVVGKKYILASGAHTGGTAIPEATCLAVNGSNALMITHGLYGAACPGSGELDISSYMGGLSAAVNDAYLPRAQGGIITSTTFTVVSVYNGSVWDDTYNEDVRNILADAASKYSSLGGSHPFAWIATHNTGDSNYWEIKSDGSTDYSGYTARMVNAPTFILDLTRVQISGAYISLANPEGQVDAHNVSYGDSDVDTALTELNSKIVEFTYAGTTSSSGNLDISSVVPSDAVVLGIKATNVQYIVLPFIVINGANLDWYAHFMVNNENHQVANQVYVSVKGKYMMDDN